MTEMVKKGQFAWIDGGRARTSTTNIANLVHAMNLALTKGRVGEAYFVLDDEPVVFREFASRMLMTVDVQPPLRDMPGWLVRSIAWLTETLWRTLGIKSKPPLTRFTANIMSRDCILVDAKARSELDYLPVKTREEGLKALAHAAGTSG
jgi:nucleoside-diphosphate-sugar epimerase